MWIMMLCDLLIWRSTLNPKPAAIAIELYKMYFNLTPKSEKKSMNKPDPKFQFSGMNGSPKPIEYIMQTRGSIWFNQNPNTEGCQHATG
jgi:hypothetical protein